MRAGPPKHIVSFHLRMVGLYLSTYAFSVSDVQHSQVESLCLPAGPGKVRGKCNGYPYAMTWGRQ